MPTPLPARHQLLLTLLSAALSQQTTGSLLENVISQRAEYWENCNRTLSAAFPNHGNFCKGAFDMFVCWPHSAPGNVSVPCPSFLPWITEGSSRKAYRECLENGSWRRRENSSEPWRDNSECVEEQYFKDTEDEKLRHNALRLISVTGYSLSLFSLMLATLVMGVLRKLHCTRNFIHMNLFVSFILRAVAVISKEIILLVMYSNLPKDDPGWNTYSSSPISVMCKFSKVCLEYFVACNYFWLLVEAIFLHTLLFTAVLTKRRLLKKYMLLGWGTPVLFVTPWTVLKILYENTGCWPIMNRGFWWIIRGPITFSVLTCDDVMKPQAFTDALWDRHVFAGTFAVARVQSCIGLGDLRPCVLDTRVKRRAELSTDHYLVIIFFIFIKILMLLLSKLKADQVKFTDYRYSLARATLVLIPLLGIHEVVFTVLVDECMEGSSRYARNFINLTLSSFQGFLVAVLYCFANGEVQGEMKKRWQLFLFNNHFKVRGCLGGAPLKQLWKSTHGQNPQTSQQCDSSDEGGLPMAAPYLLQVSAHRGGRALGLSVVRAHGLRSYDNPGLDFLTRKSLSSSDGEMTLGETMEEILEESQF